MQTRRITTIVTVVAALTLLLATSSTVAGPPVEGVKGSSRITLARTPASRTNYQRRPADEARHPGADGVGYTAAGGQMAPASASAAAGPHLSGEIVISAIDNEQYLPAVAYNWKHKEYLVVWHNTWGGGGRDIYAQRITARGELKSWFAVSAGPKDRAQPSVAYDPVNDRYLVVWIYDLHGDGSDWNVYGRFIPWDGPSASLTEFTICTWTTSQWNPQVAYARAQEEFLVVWTNTYAAAVPPAYVSGRRVYANGTGFPAGGFTIASHATENRVNPDVAYNLARNEYLVTYGNAVDIFGVRLRGDGVPLGAGEFGIAGWPDTEQHPAVAACDAADQYLVAWQSKVPADVYARFIKGDGTPDSVHLIYGTPVAEVEPDVACNMSGRQYLVVWQQQYSNVMGPYGVWGRLVSADKTMSPEFGIIAGGWVGAPADRTKPAVAGSYTSYLVAWEHERYGTSYQDIHGRLIWPHVVFLPLLLRNFS